GALRGQGRTPGAAWGRLQPRDGLGARLVAQAPTDQGMQPVRHTFFRHNYEEPTAPTLGPPPSTSNTLKIGFDWMVHLDRTPTSPMEMLHVSGVGPHQLTHTFVNAAGAPQQHLAPWTDPTRQDSRLYRVLEFVQTTPRGAVTV